MEGMSMGRGDLSFLRATSSSCYAWMAGGVLHVLLPGQRVRPHPELSHVTNAGQRLSGRLGERESPPRHIGDDHFEMLISPSLHPILLSQGRKGRAGQTVIDSRVRRSSRRDDS